MMIDNGNDMDPCDEGFKARQRGEDATANPYHQFTERWLSWADGWKDLDDHLRERDEALESIKWFG
jgi:hypothetical protein